MQLETAECGGWSLLPAARCFLPSLQSGDVRFHVHIQTSINFQVSSLLLLRCCPNTARFDRNKLISLSARTKIVRTLPVRAKACFHAPPSQNPAPAPSAHPPSQMHADVFVSLPLPSRRLALCACDTPYVSINISENHSSYMYIYLQEPCFGSGLWLNSSIDLELREST